MNEDLNNQEQLEQPETEQVAQPEEAPVENTEVPAENGEEQPTVSNDDSGDAKLYTKEELTRIVEQRASRIQAKANKILAKKEELLRQGQNLQPGQQQVPEPMQQPQNNNYYQVDPSSYQAPPVPQINTNQGYPLPPTSQVNPIEAFARNVGISVDDMARIQVETKDLQQDNPALFTDYINNIITPLGDNLAAPIVSVASSYEGGLEKMARLGQTEEGRNKLIKIAQQPSVTKQVKEMSALIENYGKKAAPIIPDRSKKLVNTSLPPSDSTASKSVMHMSVKEQLAAIPRGG